MSLEFFLELLWPDGEEEEGEPETQNPAESLGDAVVVREDVTAR
jgi:hypothetical protein